MPTISRLTRWRWWLDNRTTGAIGYYVWLVGNKFLCFFTGHIETENVNVRRRWDTHCAWCGAGMKPHLTARSGPVVSPKL